MYHRHLTALLLACLAPARPAWPSWCDVNIAYLIDTSGSLVDLTAEVAKFSATFLTYVDDADFEKDEGIIDVGIILFGGSKATVYRELESGQEVDETIEGLRNDLPLKIGGGTPTAEAIQAAVTMLKRGQSTIVRTVNVVVIFSDGEPNDVARTLEEAEKAKKQGILIYTIYVSEKDSGRETMLKIATDAQSTHSFSSFTDEEAYKTAFRYILDDMCIFAKDGSHASTKAPQPPIEKSKTTKARPHNEDVPRDRQTDKIAATTQTAPATQAATTARATTTHATVTDSPETTPAKTEAPKQSPTTTELPQTTEAPTTQGVPLTTEAPSTQRVPPTTDAPGTQGVPLTTDASPEKAPLTTKAPDTPEVTPTPEGTCCQMAKEMFAAAIRGCKV